LKRRKKWSFWDNYPFSLASGRKKETREGPLLRSRKRGSEDTRDTTTLLQHRQTDRREAGRERRVQLQVELLLLLLLL